LRGKGGGLYEEGIRVPLWVKDPTGQFGAQTDIPRTQVTSMVDLVPMLLTMATGDTSWKADPDLAYLANRFDLTSVMQDASAPGRDYALHTTDEDGFEYGPLMFPFLDDAPFHVMGVMTEDAKLGVYTDWADDSEEILPDGQEYEFYDYTTDEGKLELANTAGPDNQQFTEMFQKLMTDLVPNELRAPLPEPLETARRETMAGSIAKIAYDRAVG
jgi:arylsulfatase A-like enzyme